MYILDRQWTGGFLDEHCGPGRVRVAVRSWRVLGAVDDAYVVRAIDPRLVWNYLREIGPRQVWKKVVSRSRERLRNKKYAACGLGTVLESGDPSVAPGAEVAFFAPFHPRCVDRVVTDARFVAPAPAGALGRLPAGSLLFQDLDPEASDPDESGWKTWAGWTPDSGVGLPADAARACAERLGRALDGPHRGPSRILPKPADPVAEQRGALDDQKGGGAAPGRIDAVLFGYGNYAKTALIPNLDPRIHLAAVHEVDPSQLGRASRFRCRVDTSGVPREGERADVYFIAGFHHTHADLAVHALEQGAFAVVEKPLATTFEQLERLERALKRHPGRYFAGFHKRYSAVNPLLRQDLGLDPGDGRPVSCQCVVFEIPLPARHWYRWPNSCSRLVSNGCHWVDHFLFLNGYAPPTRKAVFAAANGDLNVALELANGAAFSMALTDQGSARIGVQEYVEFRAGDATASVRNGRHYRAETTRKVLRRRTFDKLSTYRVMYREISRRIVAGEPGDSLDSVVVSAAAVLELEELLRAGRNQAEPEAEPVGVGGWGTGDGERLG